MMEYDTPLPPASFQDHPAHVILRIHSAGGRYRLEAYAQDMTFVVPIEMSLHDLEALNKEFHRIVESIVSRKNPTQKELEEQLPSLAEEGHYAFQKVLGHASTRTLFQDTLRSATRVSIRTVSEDFFLPWELLYPFSLHETVSFENFWGMNHIIFREIVQQDRPGAFVQPAILTSLPRVGLMTYRELPMVGENEAPFFEGLHEDGRIHLFKLRALDPTRKQEEFREFRDFWANEFDLAHVACHALYQEESPHLSYILLSDEFPISLRDMEIFLVDDKCNPLIIQNYPLVILNACEAGNLNPLYTSSFARAFLSHGARGVVATECVVPDAFAADFAEKLYGDLLAGKPLGESLLATRKYFFEEHRNPLGLLYSMYARPSIRLERVDVTGETQ
jgi:hypothetical protein